MPTPSELLRDKWLDALLPIIADGGSWSHDDVAKAAQIAGLDAGEQALAAPHGPVMLIDHFFDQAEARTRAAAAEIDLTALRTEPRMTELIKIWLAELSPHHEAVRQAAYYGMRPWQAAPGMRRIWSVADLIWELAGDTSDDINFYTKRGLLSSTLPSIVLFWIESPTELALEQHISTRLRRAAKLGKNAGSLIKPVISRFRPPPPEN